MSFRKSVILALVILVPIGFATKLYHGSCLTWVNGQLGGLFYEIFWCLVAAFFWPKVNPWRIAVTVCLITCALEFTQLWHPSFLVTARENFIGRTLIGHAFHWKDFPCYFIGSSLGGFINSLFQKYSKDSRAS